MRQDAGATGWIDDASAVLPPPLDESAPARDELWHTASFAAITREPTPRRKLTVGLAFLSVALVAVCSYAGVQLAALGGLTPPSPPRYVVTDVAIVAPGPQPVVRRDRHGPAGAPHRGYDTVRILRGH